MPGSVLYIMTGGTASLAECIMHYDWRNSMPGRMYYAL